MIPTGVIYAKSGQSPSEGMYYSLDELNGKQIGGKAGTHYTVKKAAAAKEIILKHSAKFGGALNDTECIKLAGISRNSYYKYVTEIVNERMMAE